MKSIILIILCLCSQYLNSQETEALRDAPVLYKGRFRPQESYARLWLYDVYHRQTIKPEDRELFLSPSGSALDFLWKLQLLGSDRFKKAPLFWIHYAHVKEWLGLNLKKERFSYEELKGVISPGFLEKLVVQAYLENGVKSGKIELKNLTPGLWVVPEKGELRIVQIPSNPLFHGLKNGVVIPLKEARFFKPGYEEALRLLSAWDNFSRLENTLFPIVPSKKGDGNWIPSIALTSTKNISELSDEHYHKLREAYLNLKQGGSYLSLASALQEAYQALEGKTYRETNGKSLTYPSKLRLQLESWYYRFPLIECVIGLYCLVLVFYCCGWAKGAFALFGAAFLCHTLLLVLRISILGRPAVSNMFETVIYVPWVAALAALLLRPFVVLNSLIAAASFVAVALLALLEITQSNASMENVQAVLDSQYWLIIHVLMVVGSYGLFLLAGVLGHIYLIQRNFNPRETEGMKQVAKGVLQALYIGVALLIPGTLLGGVWAAESWGRFWDWDPKESWAFISSCIYLIIVHAYTFGHIAHFGLAVGAILGLLSISFTWYGVNYILGTGLHSYGFGNGGEVWYYLYISAELLFIAWACSRPYWKGKIVN